MKIGPYVEKLHNSQEFKTFQEQYTDSYVAAGFFVLDFEAGKNMHQIDYYVPKEKKVAAFTLDHGIAMQMLSLMNSKTPEQLDLKTNIDLEALKGIIEDEMKNRNMTESIQKIIAIIQSVDNKKLWNINCVLSGMHILRAHVDDASKTVLKMEKASIMDYVKRMPAGQNPQAQQQSQEKEQPVNKDQAQEQLKKLEQLEQAIEKEKAELKKKL